MSLALCYSCIAPLILVFAGLGMAFVHFVYKYNLIYAYDADVDTKGLLYPKALMQLFIGLYLAEICLVGLFALNSAFGPLLLMILFLVFTAMVHISLSDALGPLLNNLPRTLALQDQSLAEDSTFEHDLDVSPNNAVPPEVQGGAASDYYNMEEGFGMDINTDQSAQPAQTGAAAEYYNPDEPFGTDAARSAQQIDTTAGPPTAAPRAVEGASTLASSLGKFAWLAFTSKLTSSAQESSPSPSPESRLTSFLSTIKTHLTPDPNHPPNFLMKFLHPEIYADFHVLSKMMPPGAPEVTEVPDAVKRRGCLPPEMWTPPPRLWIPRDEARVSRQEVAHTRGSVPITDRGAWLDLKGMVEVDLGKAPMREVRVLY
jgi:hypothetical protein